MRGDEQVPAVHEHEQHDLEEAGNDGRAHGISAHGHQDRGDHHVDDEEGKKTMKPTWKAVLSSR